MIGCGGRGTGAAIDCLKADLAVRDRRHGRPGSRSARQFARPFDEGVPVTRQGSGSAQVHGLRQLRGCLRMQRRESHRDRHAARIQAGPPQSRRRGR